MYSAIFSKYNLSNIDIFKDENDAMEHILAYILNKRLMDIKLMKDITLTVEEQNKLEQVLYKLCVQKIPFQYITGEVYLYNEKYYVTDAVLIPRQDTESIIEVAIEIIDRNNFKTMLDLCTGSGAIGISVAKNSNIDSVDMIDISYEALSIANKNIILNEASNKCHTIQSDIFSKIVDKGVKYDIIVSNPPYITKADYAKLSQYVKKEPKMALLAQDNGMYFYKKIANESKLYLNNGGILLFEIGFTQAKEVTDILKKEGFSNIDIYKDINSKDRVIKCRFQSR